MSILTAYYSYAETVKEFWETPNSVYGNIFNLSGIFEVKKVFNDLQQEKRSFTKLFGDFRELWTELEMLIPPITNLKEMMERREQDQIFGLLSNFNGSPHSKV